MVFLINISLKECEIRVSWPQLPIVWHQACPIWLMQLPQPPNCYLLWGRFMFEVVCSLRCYFTSFRSCFVLEPPIRREIEWTNYTTNQKRRLIWYLSIQLSNQSGAHTSLWLTRGGPKSQAGHACQFSHKQRKYKWMMTNFGGHDAMKSPRKSFKILVVRFVPLVIDHNPGYKS